jgi:hypothetical protein
MITPRLGRYGDTRRRFLAGGALALALAGCATEAPVRTADRETHDAEGGIGGTGVFGPITGFGSIIVADRRIETDLFRREAFADAVDLAIGEVVAVVAYPGEGGLSAAAIERVVALSGPVTRPAADGFLEIMGTRVAFDAATRFLDRDGRRADPALHRVGETLAASGLWRDHTLVATRLRPARAGTASASGLVYPADEDGRGRRIGGLPLIGADEAPLSYCVARGAWTGSALEVADLELRGLTPFGSRVSRVVIDGFMARDPEGPGHHMSGVGLPRDPASPAAPLTGRRAVFEGSFADRFAVETVTPR